MDMEHWRNKIRNPEDRKVVTFIELAYNAMKNNPDLNDEDFRLLAFNLRYDPIDLIQIGWSIEEQVRLAEKRQLPHHKPLSSLWEKGLQAGVFFQRRSDGLDAYRKAFE